MKTMKRRSLFGTFGMARLARHFAAQTQVRRERADSDSIIELRRLAVLVAVDKFKGDVDLACAWMVEAGFGDDVVNGLRTYVRRKIDEVRG